jgi:hypothetical protein
MTFKIEDKGEQGPSGADTLGEIARRPLRMGRPDTPYERALSRSWMAKAVFTLNGKPMENIRDYLNSLDPVLRSHITGK